MTKLDHGLLNVPLSKRGNIDAQIDAYKKEQAQVAKKIAKEKAAEIRELRTTAKALLAGVSKELIEELANHCKATPSDIRKKLSSDAHFQPAFVIKLLTPKV